MEQQKLDKNKSTDELVTEKILKSIDDQIEIVLHRKEVLKKQDEELDMQIKQLNFQRKNLLKKRWRKAL